MFVNISATNKYLNKIIYINNSNNDIKKNKFVHGDAVDFQVALSRFLTEAK